MKYLFKDKALMILLLLGLIIRLSLSLLPSFKFDMDAWFAWAIRLNQVGFSHFYSDSVWTNYTPGYLYVLGVLGFIKNLLHLNDFPFLLLLKLPAILSEITLGVFVYYLMLKRNYFWAIIAASLILFNPVFIFNSSIWGQIDGLLILMLILSIYFLDKKRIVYSSIFWGLAFLIKPQAIAILPIFILFFIRNLSIKNFLKISIPPVLTVFLLSLPFFPTQPFLGIPKLFSKMVSDYPYTSMYAYNFWGIVGFWIKDNVLWNNFSYKNWGYILIAGYWTAITYFYFKNKLSLYTAAAMANLAFFFLPTRAHERYLYPAIVFLIIAAAQLKSKLLLILTAILSIIHLLNLYQVYIYYNEIYLKLPKTLYIPFIYNLLDSSSKTLSVISLAIFIIISVTIIKINGLPKKT